MAEIQDRIAEVIHRDAVAELKVLLGDKYIGRVEMLCNQVGVVEDIVDATVRESKGNLSYEDRQQLVFGGMVVSVARVLRIRDEIRQKEIVVATLSIVESLRNSNNLKAHHLEQK